MKKGFSVVEVLLAAGLFAVFGIGAVVLLLRGLDANRVSSELVVANQFASEGLEAARSIRNQVYANLANSGGTGIIRNGSNVWAFSGVNNVFDKYTRVIAIAETQRDVSGNIVASGGTVDPNTKKITSTVSWNVNAGRNNSVVLTTYLTDWKRAMIGNWASPIREGGLDLTGAQDGFKVQVVGNFAYLVRNFSGVGNFVVVNISNPASPTLVGSMTLGGVPQNLSVVGSYAYVASSSDTQELQVVNVSTPATPTLAGSLDLTGTTDASSVVAVGTRAYVTRLSSANNEFNSINVTTPTTPALLGSLDLNGNGNGIVVSGNNAFVASSDNAQEMKVINITNPAAMTQIGSLNLAGNTDATAIALYGNSVFISQTTNMFTVNVTTPATPAQLGVIAIGGNVNDIAINLGNSGTYVFLATSNAAAEFRVVNVTTLATPVILGSVNLTGTSPLFGVSYDSNVDRAFAVGQADSEEFVVIAPQ